MEALQRHVIRQENVMDLHKIGSAVVFERDNGNYYHEYGILLADLIEQFNLLSCIEKVVGEFVYEKIERAEICSITSMPCDHQDVCSTCALCDVAESV